MEIKQARKLASFLKGTPFHPQWRVFHQEKRAHKYIANNLVHDGNDVIDIGCGHKDIQKYLPTGIKYIGLDLYETAKDWYRSKPDVYADAHDIPLKSSTVDHVLLLEVLEHLKSPEKAISEISRILKPEGTAIISIPFLYPLHDEPYDFRRWTRHGIKLLIEDIYDLKVREITEFGSSITSSTVLFNLALTEYFILQINKSKLNWIFSPLIFTGILISNIFSLLDLSFKSKKSIAPLGYLIVVEKK